MKSKNVWVSMILVLATAKTGCPKADAFFLALSSTPPAFGEEFYPVSLRDRNETRQTVEASPQARPDLAGRASAWVSPNGIGSRLEVEILPSVSGSDACYRLMSLQC
jgi:hypothetical protein